MKKVKVAYFLGALNRGGAESLILDVCKNHAIAPYDFICIYRKEGNYSDEFHKSGTRLCQLARKGGLLGYLWSLRQLVLRERIDIVHAQTLSNAWVSLFCLMGTKIKVYLTLHGHFGGTSTLLLKILCRCCHRVFCVSQSEKIYYEGRGIRARKGLHVVYNGVNFSKIDSAKPNIALSQSGRIRLVMVGNFVSGRSQNVIVKSIHLLKQRGIVDFDFYFVGRRVDSEPWRYDYCVQYCQEHGLDNVRFMGARNDVPSILKAMDGFVYSSESDTFGIAVVEAMAAGLPVVVNDWVVMKEVTHNGQWATLYKTDDVTDCADKIEDLMHNLESRKLQAQQIAQVVKQEYSIERHISELAELYKDNM